MKHGNKRETGTENNIAERSGEANEEGFIDSIMGKCRLVGGKLLCEIGEHDYEEVRREKLHGGEDEVVHLKCRRNDCGQIAWTEWQGGKRVL